jgi:transglutaminase-like putative cysteine protease
MPWLFAAPITLVLLGRWLQRARGGGARVPLWLKLPLIAIFPILIIFHFGTIFGRAPGSALACAMLALKLVETESRRDARAAVCFSSFVLMSALLSDSSLGFTLLLLAALCVFLAALRELESEQAHSRPWPVALREDLRGGAAALGTAVPLALCVFVFFPRLGSPLWGAPGDSTARTGLSDSMAPGTMQDLLVDDSPAFRAAFDAAPAALADMYWRGPVLWQFDGRAWTRPEFFASSSRSGDVQAVGEPVGYEITLEPSQRHWLLALDVPLSAPDGAVRGADMSLVSRQPIDSLLVYHLTSAPHYVLEQKLSAEHRRLALQLPTGFDPRARELAQRWRAQLDGDEAVIRAALELFHNEFTYTLDAPQLARDTIDDFLFGEKKGFCEHFASAFTFLMRAAGIPTRVVTGYQGGYLIRAGHYWLIRQSDAHAWTEVWLDGRGWVRVDPTAAVAPRRIQLGARAAAGDSVRWYQSDWLLDARNRFDLINRFWNSAVVQFNVLRQQGLLTPFGIDKAQYSDLMAVLIGLGTLLLALFTWWVLRAPRATGDALDVAYARLCAKLARAGVPRAPTEGPLALAARVAALWPAQELASLIADYAGLRYAQRQPPPPRVLAFARAVAALRLPAIAQSVLSTATPTPPQAS